MRSVAVAAVKSGEAAYASYDGALEANAATCASVPSRTKSGKCWFCSKIMPGLNELQKAVWMNTSDEPKALH